MNNLLMSITLSLLSVSCYGNILRLPWKSQVNVPHVARYCNFRLCMDNTVEFPNMDWCQWGQPGVGHTGHIFLCGVVQLNILGCATSIEFTI